MWEAVWVGCHAQPWCNHIILTPQVTQNANILGQKRWAYLCKAATICLWTPYQCAQKLLYVPNMDVRSSLMLLSGSTMMWWHHLNSTMDPECWNPRPTWAVQLYMAATICLWTAKQCTQTLCMYPRWMWEAVWGGCQAQPWSNDIALTPKVTQSANILSKIEQYNWARLLPYVFEQHINVLKQFLCPLWIWEAV
jgi:hypothetical protein